MGIEPVYVEELADFELQDLIDDIVINAKTISDRGTKVKYLKVGAGFDIETSKLPVAENELGVNTVSYCYHWQFGFHDKCIMGRTLSGMQNFFKMLIESIKSNKKNHKLLVFDANLGYEWQFCKHYWKELEITDVFCKEERNPLYIEISKTLILKEVIGLFGKSLAHIASNYCGIEKLVGDLDYDKVRLSDTPMTEKEIGYCIRDVEILVTLAENHVYKNFMGKNPRLPLTKTGIVRDAIKREYGKRLKEIRKQISSIMPSESEYEEFREYLFKGGISGSNILILNKVLKNVRGADITSDYPFQMLTKMFPMGKAERCKEEEFMTEKLPYIAHIRFFKFKTRSSHSLMSAHKALNKREMKESCDVILDNNRIQYAQFVELLLNDVEFRALKKAYKWDKMWIKRCWKFPDGYEMLPIEIRRVVIEKYMIKENLKRNGYSETLDYKEAKEFVNSIFGMMCTALYMEEFIFDEEHCEIVADMSSKTYEDACKYLFLSPYWGFWVTSYAREMLMDVITKFPDIIVQYDTDSVYYIYDENGSVSTPLEKYLNERNEAIQRVNDIRFMKEPLMRTLGTWTFTEVYKRFKGLGAKRYIYEKQNGDVKTVVTGCRYNSKKKVSTIVDQCNYNNEKNGTNIDIFDFFSEGMTIDKDHSCKLASKYVDAPVSLDINGEILKIPSCLVLEPVEFTMNLATISKLDFILVMQRYIENHKDRRVYDLWRELRKSNTLTMTKPLALTMTGI